MPSSESSTASGSAAFVDLVEDLAAMVPAGRRRPVEPRALVCDLARIGYRLVFADLVARRGGVLDRRVAVGGLGLDVLADIPEGVLAMEVPEVDDNPAALGAAHEHLLMLEPRWDGDALRLDRRGTGRKTAGAWFTPTRLVDHLLDETLEPALDEADREGRSGQLTVLDPACGAGAFLVPAARRIAARTGDLAGALQSVRGVDLDPAVLELARICLWLELGGPGERVQLPALRLERGDALALDLPEHDVVVGNPPFLSQLSSLTVRRADGGAARAARAARAVEAAGAAGRPYTDTSALFLARSVDWLRDGGRVGLVQPQSVLAARDARDVRARLVEVCALESVWASDVPVFEAGVLTCAPVLRKGADQQAVRRTHGPAFAPVPPRPMTTDDLRGEWSFLLGTALGVPEVDLRGTGTVGDLATCTADFRDQYYGLAGHVHEAARLPGGVPLVTSGLVDPAESRWGRAGVRFLKERWHAPVVDVTGLPPAMARWAEARLVPKVLVGTQGRVVEAVADEHGAWLPSVPVITVMPDPSDLWRVLAVLLAPPVSAYAAARYAGTALTMTAVKLSASQVARIPLPTRTEPWDAAATAVRRAQADDEARRELLLEAGALMCRAYEVDEPDEVLAWWAGRLRPATR